MLGGACGSGSHVSPCGDGGGGFALSRRPGCGPLLFRSLLRHRGSRPLRCPCWGWRGGGQRRLRGNLLRDPGGFGRIRARIRTKPSWNSGPRTYQEAGCVGVGQGPPHLWRHAILRDLRPKGAGKSPFQEAGEEDERLDLGVVRRDAEALRSPEASATARSHCFSFGFRPSLLNHTSWLRGS